MKRPVLCCGLKISNIKYIQLKRNINIKKESVLSFSCQEIRISFKAKANLPLLTHFFFVGNCLETFSPTSKHLRNKYSNFNC